MTSSSCASTRDALAVAAESASTVKSSPARTRSSFAGRGDRLGEQSALVGVIDFFAERSNASVASRAASLSSKDAVVALTDGDARSALDLTPTGLSGASLKTNPLPR